MGENWIGAVMLGLVPMQFLKFKLLPQLLFLLHRKTCSKKEQTCLYFSPGKLFLGAKNQEKWRT